MSKTWFTSDHHFHHANILTFKDEEGAPIRPGFTSLNHMNEYMVEKWNSVIKPQDKVYHLGDILMGSSIESFRILERLNGRKVLIKGNHDTAKIHRYTEHFTDIRSEIHKKTSDGDKIIFTHRPILLGEGTDNIWNVHGHLHQRELADNQYLNICVEHWDYTPIEWNEIVEIIRVRRSIFS